MADSAPGAGVLRMAVVCVLMLGAALLLGDHAGVASAAALMVGRLGTLDDAPTTTVHPDRVQALASKLSATMVAGLNELAHGHRPARMATLSALMTRDAVERVEIDGQVVRRVTPLGWRMWAARMHNAHAQVDPSMVDRFLSAPREAARMAHDETHVARARRLAYFNAAEARHHATGFGGNGPYVKALQGARKLEQWADSIVWEIVPEAHPEPVSVAALPEAGSVVAAPRYADGRYTGMQSAEIVRDASPAAEPNTAVLVRFADGHESNAYVAEIRPCEDADSVPGGSIQEGDSVRLYGTGGRQWFRLALHVRTAGSLRTFQAWPGEDETADCVPVLIDDADDYPADGVRRKALAQGVPADVVEHAEASSRRNAEAIRRAAQSAAETTRAMVDRARAEAKTETADTLNDRMEMDHVVQVLENGIVADRPDLYAPESVMIHGPVTELFGLDGWTPVDCSGPASGDGPLMHPSEQLSGPYAARLLAEPGVYVAVVVYDGDSEYDESDGYELAGWMVLRLDRVAVLETVPASALAYDHTTRELRVNGHNARGETAGMAIAVTPAQVLSVGELANRVNAAGPGVIREVLEISDDLHGRVDVVMGRTPNGTGYLRFNDVRIDLPALNA